MQVITEPDGVTFVRDDWKAPYWSLSAALHFMREARATRKVVVIGTLSDYSDKATKLYPKVARLAREVADYVVFVGPHALRGAKARRSDDDDTIVGFPNIRDAVRHLQSFLRAGDVVLLKGSNKADHLVRIILNRTRPVQCWRDRCGLPRFCRRCDHLFQPMGDDVKGIREMSATVLTSESSCSDSARFVIVGLGNPGDRNNRTPHNVGYRAVDALAVAGGATWEEQVEGWTSVVEIDGTLIRLLKPRTNMNESGPAVQQFLQRLGTDPSKCVIVHDDNDLALGDVRVKSEGGDAGHKGVRSVISALGTGNIARIRIGVRRDGDVRKARDVVLSEFSPTDEVSLAPAISKAANSAMASILPATTQH